MLHGEVSQYDPMYSYQLGENGMGMDSYELKTLKCILFYRISCIADTNLPVSMFHPD
jgi:hypothetical protein